VLAGPVVKGHQRGRTIGIPTANLDCRDQVIPADGVYVARCTVDGTTYPVALSIGTMPTFGENARQVEAHLIGYAGDLYGRPLEVAVVDWVREQWKFKGLEPLKARMARDLEIARERYGADPAEPIAVECGMMNAE
jgi:riboflavin kinase/FMN adenylyltransferase